MGDDERTEYFDAKSNPPDEEKTEYFDTLEENTDGGAKKKRRRQRKRNAKVRRKRKRRKKKRKRRRKRKAKGRPRKRKKGRGKRVWRRSTPVMRRHHHATFNHLIHDASLRLNCGSKKSEQAGFSKKDIIKNIEKHYRLKLGAKFKKNLQKSLTYLSKSHKLSRYKGQGGLHYKLGYLFTRQYKRLRVWKGAANRRFGVEIRRSRSRSRSKSRSRSRSKGRSRCRRKRRSRSRSKSKSRSRSKDTIKNYIKKLFSPKKRRSKSKSRSRSRSRSRKGKRKSRSRSRSRKREGKRKSRSRTRGRRRKGKRQRR